MTEAHYYNERIAHFPGKGMGCWKVGGLVVCVCVVSLNKSQFFLTRAKRGEWKGEVGWDEIGGDEGGGRQEREQQLSLIGALIWLGWIINVDWVVQSGGMGRGEESWCAQGPFGINLFNWAIMKEQKRGKEGRRRKGGGNSSALWELNLKVKWLCRPSQALYSLINGPNQEGSGGQMCPVWVRAISPRLACW